MNTLTRRLALAFAAFGFTTLLTAGDAHAAPAGKRDRHEAMEGRMCARLACTDAQKAQIKTIREADAPRIKAAKQTMRTLRDQMKAEWRKAQPDARTLERLDGELDVQRDKIQDMRRNARLKIHALLTPEQRSKLTDRQGHGKGKRGGPRGNR